jgi:hypothetical protein
MREKEMRTMADDPFVAASVKRFVALAQKDNDIDGAEAEIFALVDEVRRQAQERGLKLGPIVRALEAEAHGCEVPPPKVLEEADDAAALRVAGLLHRAADMLNGPEKDLTPHAERHHPRRH